MVQSFETAAVFLMIFNGVMQTGSQTIAMTLKGKEWPYYRLMGAAMPAVSVLLMVYLVLARVPLPSREQWKWVLTRSCFGAAQFILRILAVRLGAPLGDVAALSSINTVAAAVLGRMILGEEIQRVHAVGLSCAAAGSIVIIASGVSRLDTAAIIGFGLAILCAFAQASSLICARKSIGICPAGFSCIDALLISMSVVVLVETGCVQDFTLDPLEESPQQVLAWYGLIIASTLSSTVSVGLGAVLCPAAISATVSTGATIVSSYIVDILLFGAIQEPWPVVGAALIMASLLLMATTRVTVPGKEQPTVPANVASVQLNSSGDASSVSTSVYFNSFVSVEFAAASPESASIALMQRRLKQGTGLGSHTMGRVSAAGGA